MMTRASLGTINPATTSGTTLAALLSARDAAENTQHAGTGRPSYASAGLLYAEDSTDPAHIFLAGVAGDGSQDVDLTLLFSPRPGTLRTSAEVRLPDGWLWADGSAVLRATYPNLLDAIAPAFTGDVASGSPTISNVSEDLRTLGLVGAKLEGTGITAGTTITAITATTITMSANGTASNSGVAVRALPYGAGNGSTTFNLPNAKGCATIARQDMGGTDAALITVAGAGFDGTKLAATGGAQTVVLVTANLPIHSHSASTSGTTSTSANHQHGSSGLTAATSGSHNHDYVRFGVGSFSGGTLLSATYNTGGAGDFFQGGSINTTTAGGHTHGLTGSSDPSGAHSHTLTLSTTVGNTGSDTAHQNVQPSVVFNVLVKT